MGSSDALVLQILLDFIYLILTVCLSGAVQQADLGSLWQPLRDHLSLLIQRSQVRSTRNIAAHSAGEISQAQRHAVLGNRGAQNGDLIGSSLCRLQSGRCIGHDEVYACGNKAVGDGSAGSGIVLCVLEIKRDILAEFRAQSILKTLGSGIQGCVLHQLADANGVAVASGSSRTSCRGGGGHRRSSRGGCRGAAAGGQGSSRAAERSASQERTTRNFTHDRFSPSI